MCPVVFEKPRIPGCPRCWRNAIGLLHFSFPQNMSAKEGTSPVKPVETLVQTYVLSFFSLKFQFLDCYEQHSGMMTCFPWLPSFTCMLSPAPFAFSYVELEPVVLEMHLTSCPLSLLACLVGFSRSHVVPLALVGTTQQKRALKIHRSMTIEPPNPGQSSFTQTIYNLAGVKRSYPSLPGKKHMNQ